MSDQTGKVRKRRSRLVPFAAALGLMTVLSMLSPHPVRGGGSPEPVGDIESPRWIGEWMGTDVEVPPAAVELLRPSAILSRRFSHTGDGRLFHVLIVRCTDARDMLGHYPPRCYPANGWIMEGEEGMCTLSVASKSTDVRIYNFRGVGEHGQSQMVRVYNFFVRRDGTTSPDRPRINYLRERYAGSAQGLTQVQVSLNVSNQVRSEDELEAVRELLEGHPALLGEGTTR